MNSVLVVVISVAIGAIVEGGPTLTSGVVGMCFLGPVLERAEALALLGAEDCPRKRMVRSCWRTYDCSQKTP